MTMTTAQWEALVLSNLHRPSTDTTLGTAAEVLAVLNRHMGIRWQEFRGAGTGTHTPTLVTGTGIYDVTAAGLWTTGIDSTLRITYKAASETYAYPLEYVTEAQLYRRYPSWPDDPNTRPSVWGIHSLTEIFIYPEPDATYAGGTLTVYGRGTFVPVGESATTLGAGIPDVMGMLAAVDASLELAKKVIEEPATVAVLQILKAEQREFRVGTAREIAQIGPSLPWSATDGFGGERPSNSTYSQADYDNGAWLE